MKRNLWIAFLFLTVGLLTYACGSGGGGIQFPNCHKDGCPAGRTCVDVGPASVCLVVPTPGSTPVATPGATATPQPGATSTPTATPTPPPVATPTPQAPTPTPSALPTPVPTPCSPTKQKVCVHAIGTTFPFDRTKCWICPDWQGYMVRNGYFTAGDPKEDGDVAGHPGYWINFDAQGVLVGFISKKDCTNKAGVLQVDWPRAEERVVECPTPVPTPSATPPPGPTPTPGPGPGGAKCAPLSHIGVSFLAQHPAPNGPLGYRWVFSATNKAVKPFCPEMRNECEQQGYEGDPVNNYAGVVWRFDLRFQCQQASGSPLWNQQEPHTGNHWENTDVRQENEWNANLKPAVKGLHRVRTCTRDAPGPEFGDAGGNCRFAEKVAN